ncbi:HlyD family type I secretion periplasmic adaptor subunit [Coralliovum pocilloporae]|uniref:HlyD family type I secretion periplasmic adaptor subunit n=1 Tax=Coralliovum pocilloporae TaxID=3066369 RepID=UPI0033069D8A
MSEQSMPQSSPAAHGEQILSQSIRRHLVWAAVLIVTLFGGIGAWAALTEISGAVVASGVVVVETNTKQVQHQEGGIVRTIQVRNGDAVKAGDLLIRLDDTVTRANLSVITQQLDELSAQEARLIAEQSGADGITFPDQISSNADARALRLIRDSQSQLLEARRKSLSGRKTQLREQITQFEKQIDGLTAQRDAKAKEIKLIREELVDLEKLLAQELVSSTRVTALKRDEARLEGEHGGFIAQIAQTREGISERSIQILQIEEEARADVLQQLQETRSRIAQLQEQRIAAEDQLTRVDIRAPRSGFVHNLSIHTIGGVIGPAETVMVIVPREDLLVVEAQVQPVDIDQLTAEQQATIRLPSFDQRTTPELKATLKTVSADLTQDQVSGLSYYLVRLTIPDEELAKLNGKRLIPGMPVEAFLKTEDRTVLSYIVKPITDQIAHALKER